MLVTLNEILPKAQSEHYAVGLFNTTDTDILEAAISAAEELLSPIIIGTAEVLLPYGELSLIAPSIIYAAKKASVPVCVHYDHGLTFERCIEAMKLGFSSVMFDGSVHKYKENAEMTREIVKIAHTLGISVEGEIGHVGAAEGDSDKDLYTTTDEARRYLADTGVDALAVSIGTAHGNYTKKPCLDLQRLYDIKNAVSVPLVLHGGSGLSDDDFKNSIKNGISKVNIFTDLLNAGKKAMDNGIANSLDYLDIRNYKVEEIKKEIIKKIRIFGSVGKA